MTREEGFYWFKPGPNEPWEVAQWDQANECWWVHASETPWTEEATPSIVVGPKVEPPEASEKRAGAMKFAVNALEVCIFHGGHTVESDERHDKDVVIPFRLWDTLSTAVYNLRGLT
jgi:hypothetical protein